MNLERFEAQRGPDWVRLDAPAAAAPAARRGRRRGAARLGAHGVLELGALYRGAAADLAYARRRFPGDPVVARLEALVTRGRAAVYGRAPRRGSVRAFFSRGYWRRLAERPGDAWRWPGRSCSSPRRPAPPGALADPGAAVGLVAGRLPRRGGPAGRRAATSAPARAACSPRRCWSTTSRSRSSRSSAACSSAWARSPRSFFNGLLLGVLGGLAFGAGNGEAFVRLLSSHGPLELSCIVVGGVAGPAARPRADRARAAHAAAVAAARGARERRAGGRHGAVAGALRLPEGLADRAGAAREVQVTIGLALAAVFWGLVVWRGRASAAEGRWRQGGAWRSGGAGVYCGI